MPNADLIDFLALIAAPATNSGLIVLLPLVGAILGGIVGAVGGAWANSWYRDREAKKAEDREREGLLLLVHAEIQGNDFLLHNLCFELFPATRRGSTAHPLTASHFTRLRTATWTEVKVKLVPLLTREHRAALIHYYWQVQNILNVVNDNKHSEDDKVNIAVALGESAIKFGTSLTTHSAKYLSLDDLNYSEAAEEADVFLYDNLRMFDQKPKRSTDN